MWQKLGNREREAILLINIGNLYGQVSDFAEALDYYKRSLAISRELDDKRGIANTLGNVGLAYRKMGDYARALDNYFESLKFSRASGNRAGEAVTLANIGAVYGYMENDVEAEKYLRQAAEAFRRQNNPVSEAAIKMNIGMILSSRENHRGAMTLYHEAYGILKASGDKGYLSYLFSNFGQTYNRLGLHDSAAYYYNKALVLDEEAGNKSQIVHSLAGLSEALLQSGADARPTARRALRLARETQSPEDLEAATIRLALADSAAGDYASAFRHLRRNQFWGDSLLRQSKSKEIGRLEAQYGFDQEIEARERAAEAAEERREFFIWIAAGAFAALLLVAGLLSWGLQTKRKANNQLALQNAEIKLQSEEIKQQNEEINAHNDVISEKNAELDTALAELRELSQFKESMTGMLVHDLKNPLSVVLGRAELAGDARLKAAALQMNGLTMNMLDVQKFESASVNLELQPASARQIAAAALEQVAFLAEEKNIALVNDADANLYIFADESYMVRVLVNLLNNAVKFTPYGGTIRISAIETSEGVAELAVTDSGAGIPEDKLDAVFDKFSKLDDKAGQNKQGTGLGLTFCKLAAEAHGGSIRAENAPEGGARFRLTLPRAETPEGAARVAIAQPEPLSAAAELTQEDKAALTPVLVEIQQYEIYETSEISDILERLAQNDSPGLAAWRRRAEAALFALDEEALASIVVEAEA